MDVPDSSDYWEDIRQHLMETGIASGNILAISAATGEGVRDLVRRLRAVLDEMPQTVGSIPHQCQQILSLHPLVKP